MPKKKKKRGPTHRTKNPRTRINQELRAFNARIKKWVDGTRIEWDGEPFVTGSIYRFVLDDRLVQFITTLKARAEQSEAMQAQAATLKMAESIQLANAPEPDDFEPTEPTPESEAAYEKFLTDLEPEGIIDSDGEEVETEAEGEAAEEAPTGSPERPSGDEGSPGAMGPIESTEGLSEPR